tara:strand:+ start:417 stop:626 length:210 start_codon:yes stop_codon:yes gene_type:complete
MNDEYKIPDILEAVDTLLKNKKEKPLILEDDNEKPLRLTDQIKDYKIESNTIPKDTEKIIVEAEKYLKK